MKRDSSSHEWVSLNRLPLGARNFQAELVEFCDQVRRENNDDPSVMVVLPPSDILCGTVSIIGRTNEAKEKHVKRTLARLLGDQADNVVADFGKCNDDKIAPVCYALTSTLETAERFVNKFGFRVLCFSTESETGLDHEPCLMLPHQVARFQSMNAAPKVSYAFRGAAASLFLSSFIIAADIPDPNEVMMANILDSGNVAGQPVDFVSEIAGFEDPNIKNMSRIGQSPVQFARIPSTMNAINSSYVNISISSQLPVSGLSAVRVEPTVQKARFFDEIVAHTGGFQVYVGVQGNLTQISDDFVVADQTGEVVYIHKPTSQKYQVARAYQQHQVWPSFPEQFRLTELEMSSFSRP